jgi:hypothetical protein
MDRKKDKVPEKAHQQSIRVVTRKKAQQQTDNEDREEKHLPKKVG